jgi:hypothetical protein
MIAESRVAAEPRLNRRRPHAKFALSEDGRYRGDSVSGIDVLVLVTVLLTVLGIAELAMHRRKLAQIPIRVHVNGTRGKSSVVRLIAAGLRQGGVVTCAKTTGSLARMILPDGRELPIYRPAGANIIEQKRIVAVAAEHEAKALIIECMALQPQLQSLCELKLIHATHGVITNARPDHLDVMGPHDEDVARALAGMVPVEGKLYTAEQTHLGILKASAEDRGSKLIEVTGDELEPEALEGFGYTEHADNVALALRLCGDLGVEREVALEGMWLARPDPGAMTCQRSGLDPADLVAGNRATPGAGSAHRRVQLPRRPARAFVATRLELRQLARRRLRGADGFGHLPVRPGRGEGRPRQLDAGVRGGAQGRRGVRADHRAGG